MDEPRSILVIQLRRIGDVILTTPALAALKKRYPRADIDFLVEPAAAQVLSGNPHLRRVHVYDAWGPLGALAWLRKIRAQGYDWVIDFLGNPRSALITRASGAAVRAGPAHVAHRWGYNVVLRQSDTTHYGALEKIRVLSTLDVPSAGADFIPKIYFSKLEQKRPNRVALAPASRKLTRRWPAESYGALGKLLRERFGCEVIVLWGPGEKALAGQVAALVGDGGRAAPETRDLAALTGILSSCRLLVTNCSGTKHIAVALGVPTVTVHGSSDPVSWNPPSPKHVAVRLGDLHCIGCGLNSCPYKLECMTQLPPERVFEAAARLLAEVPARK